MPSLSFEPEITEHPRARRLKLKVHDNGRVELVMPRGCCRTDALAFAAARAGWVERCLARVRARRARRDPAIHGPFPKIIRLAAAGQAWTVAYDPVHQESMNRDGVDHGAPGRVELVESRPGLLLVRGPGTDPGPAHGLLRRWLTDRARSLLEPWTKSLAAAHGLPLGRVGFRNQKTRWGSCSSTGNISLNIRLMLLAPALARYVIIHELCHLDHPDHSARFWQAVAAIEPDYRRHEAALKLAGKDLPDWLVESPRIA